MNRYYLIFKTGDAELRALEQTPIISDDFIPVIELTKGRRSQNDKIGLIQKRLEKVKKMFKDKTVIFDITTEAGQSNSELTALYNPNNGYANWVSFINDQNVEKCYSKIIPTILVDVEDQNLVANLREQVASLSIGFDELAYRSSITDSGYEDDINVIADLLLDKSIKLHLIFDCEYVSQAAQRKVREVVESRISKIKQLGLNIDFVIAATSYPMNIADICNDLYDEFTLTEVLLHTLLKTENIFYCDYGSIHNLRNDEVIMSRGWIPKIDVPTNTNTIYFYRERREGRPYSTVYSIVAKKAIDDLKFPKDMDENWGIKQIIQCANIDAPGSSPNFWISVRMSIHVERQAKRLRLI